MATKYRVRQATAAVAAANNVVLAVGELGYETDTYKIKIGRGLPWNSTPYFLSGGGGHVIQDEGVDVTVRTKLNFVGGGVTLSDDPANDATVVTIPGAGTVDPTPTDGSTNPVQSNGVFDALTTKEPVIAAGQWYQYYKGDKTWATLDKASVGLPNVDNTSDTNKPVSTAQQTALDGKADKDLSINTQTASYTLALTDRGGMVRMNVASANTLTVPPNSAVAFPVGTQLVITQAGAGQTTIVAGSGVTINASGAKMKLTGQWSGATLIQVSANVWTLLGDLSA